MLREWAEFASEIRPAGTPVSEAHVTRYVQCSLDVQRILASHRPAPVAPDDTRQPNPNNYPYKPPADAKEWTCPACGKYVLWCGCPLPVPVPFLKPSPLTTPPHASLNVLMYGRRLPLIPGDGEVNRGCRKSLSACYAPKSPVSARR